VAKSAIFPILLLATSVNAAAPAQLDPLISRLFRLNNVRWGYLNLNELAAADFSAVNPNPLIDPTTCNQWLVKKHEVQKVTLSYGGYLENRKDLWRGHYLSADNAIHLGVDYNVPEKTKVFCPEEATVAETWWDPDQNGGWGGRVILKNRKSGMYLVLAHLAPDFLVKTGDVVHRGSPIGVVGGAKINGGWFPHLHAQAMHELVAGFDGYGNQFENNQKKFPHPSSFLND
jgi:murein DD-endopeptidase MepM/ murein hydrolase activator NlpD